MPDTILLDFYHQRADVYRVLSGLPGFVLLESSDKTRGDVDIITAHPYDIVEIRETTLDPETIYATIQQKLIKQPPINSLPFQGGAIGFFSYNWGEYVYGLTPKSSTLPWIYFGFYDWAIITCHRTETMTLIACHHHAETKNTIYEILERIHAEINLSGYDDISTVAFTCALTQEDYSAYCHLIKDYLTAGRCYQTNFTTRFLSDFEGEPYALFERLRHHNPVPFSAFLSLPDAAIISASPERLLLLDADDMTVSPIKGTIRSSDSPSLDKIRQRQLLESEKERAENVMIVDLLRNDLGKVSIPKTVQVDALCALETYRGLHHLVSTISSKKIPSASMFDVFSAVFPGGSITGAPKKEAMKVIHELETSSRDIYCGSIGYFSSHGRFDFNIAIRTMTAKDGKLTLGAGGGIVMDSEADSEYAECFTKIQAIEEALS